MRHLPKIVLYVSALVLMASCTKDNPTNFIMEKPESIAVQDSLDNNFNMLRSYIDTVNSDFKLGAGVSATAFTGESATFGLVNSNFQEVTAHEFGHGQVVQGDGSLSLGDLNAFISSAQEAGISVYGNALLSPDNQNEAYLNELIAPDRIDNSEPSWELVSNADFETDDASNYQSNANAVTTFTDDGTGANGEGRAIKIVNSEVRANDWESQFFITFGPHVEAGDQFRFRMDVRAEQSVSFPTQAHNEPTQYLHWDFFGTINATTEWTEHYQQITVSEDQAGAGTIAFNLGANATTYYFDNMEVWYYNTEGGIEFVEKSDEEKEQILSEELETYVSSMVENSSYINGWNVIHGAIEGGSEDSYQLKSEGDFNWNQYLGDDFGVQAFQVAREHADTDDILFISDYGLENLNKTRGLINYVEYIENNGATVDGIGAHLDISINSSEQDITEMLELLADTGKMIKISGLNVGLGGINAGNAPPEVFQAQSDMYKFVVEQYLSIIPDSQQYGITVWNPIDNNGSSGGLWTSDYSRKRAFGGFATGLMNGFGTGN